MDSYDNIRQRYRPAHIKTLLIAESPPPSAETESSRHFYRTGRPYAEDRLFANTIRALYPEAAELPYKELEQQKEAWLRRFQQDGWYMIEALETSQGHSVSKATRQARIAQNVPNLIQRVKQLASSDTKIILIKSNVFEVAAEPLRAAGINVLNTELVDYPGRYNQTAYRQKLAKLAAKS